MSSEADFTSRILKHERLVVVGGLALLAALSWWFLLSGAGMDGAMDMGGMPPPLGVLILMWWLMMVAMMLPSATPAILLYARVRNQRGPDARVVQPWIFALGYLLAWLAFSLAAAVVQQFAAGPAMSLADARAASGVLIAAGLYQLSPLKRTCLAHCRSPAQFFSRHWRPGAAGAIRLGILHGAYCVGCCWLLMALLFVGGIMSFAWIVALAMIVAVEKLVPRGDWLGRAAGVLLIAWGLVRLIAI